MAIETNKKVVDNTLEAFQRFQEATRLGAAARADILNGITNGVPLEELLVTATDCIAVLCDNQFFADQVREKLSARLKEAE